MGPSATTGFIYSCALSNSAYKLGRSSQDSPRHCISYLTLSSSALLSSASRCSTFIIASCSSSVRKLRSIILLCVEGLAKCQEDLKSCWGEQSCSLLYRYRNIFSAGTEQDGPGHSQWSKEPQYCFLAVEYVHASLDERFLGKCCIPACHRNYVFSACPLSSALLPTTTVHWPSISSV